jgi:hypothetical protein
LKKFPPVTGVIALRAAVLEYYRQLDSEELRGHMPWFIVRGLCDQYRSLFLSFNDEIKCPMLRLDGLNLQLATEESAIIELPCSSLSLGNASSTSVYKVAVCGSLMASLRPIISERLAKA